MNAQQMKDALLPTKEACSGTACSNCTAPRPREDLVACSACKHARFCNKDCQLANWKEHKPVCKLLRAFRTVAASVPEPPGRAFRPGVFGLRERFGFFRSLCQNRPESDLFQIVEMPKNISPKTWKMTEHYLLSARCCSVCQKTEYDVPIGESKSWPNCSTCKFGWCCSEEHQAEYESHHTTDICKSNVECASMDRFRHNHIQEHGDVFLHMPSSVCLEPMDPLPCSWKEYFETRCSEEFSMKEQLPKEFFPVATLPLSQATSCLYGMYQHDKDFFTTAKTLTIHVVGAAPGYEMVGGGPKCVYEEIMHCLPSVQKINVAFVGPEACSCIDGSMNKYDGKDTACCPDCVGKSRRRTHAFYGMTYHEFAQDKDIFMKPDLILAFNTGLFEEDTDSWKISLEVILGLNIPCLFTSYNKIEADGDYAVLRELSAGTLTDGPVLNPFAVDYHEIDPSEVDTFYKINMYCICFRGRK